MLGVVAVAWVGQSQGHLGTFPEGHCPPLTPLSPPQLAAFRALLLTSSGEQEQAMANNFRPVQPLMGRRVRASFRAAPGGTQP